MHLKPKKRLGQNFLVDQNIQRKIVDFCQIEPKDTLLEIGAGRGELTRLLARKTRKIFALEIDKKLCALLKENLKGTAAVIICADILKFNLREYFQGFSEIKVVGNLPYYITTEIILHLLKFPDIISEILITVQKEFAQRITAAPGCVQASSISYFVHYFSQPQPLFNIKKGSFWPKPEVDSSFFRLTLKKKLPLDKKEEKILFKLIRAGFNQRRKVLKNALKGIVSSQRLSRYFQKYNIDENVRAEKLTLEDFMRLVRFGV
ncbi:MAG: ribosomal RNA small subunit methyltransferase A [Candidatus Omnitrophica bacterium]|nr:ribosomal RNA small subunit methyltransferase A [Candidatus Omnitrophota bacterium]